jgi:hypothetical protein
MDLKPVPYRSPLPAYAQQAESLLAGHRAADSAAIDLFHRNHPRFLDEKIKWRPKFIPGSEIRDAALSPPKRKIAGRLQIDDPNGSRSFEPVDRSCSPSSVRAVQTAMRREVPP